MKTFIMVCMLLVTTVISTTLLVSCSGDGTSGTTFATGAVTAKLVWQEATPAGVATVRVIITAAGMADIQEDYAAGAGSISGIPVGTNRTFTFQGLNADNSVTHQAVISGITITAGTTTDLGSVPMLVVVAPAPPTKLAASAVISSGSNVSWTDSDQFETGFVLERRTGPGGVWAQIATPAANIVSYSDTGLTASTTYYYRIKATNGAGDSVWSNEANVTTTAASILLAKTGQTTNYASGDDGDLEKGQTWPDPRFTDNSDGTITDNLTGLIWLKNANCFGTQIWATALTSANTLASGTCGLTDGSSAGQWHLPNRKELQSLIDRSTFNPALPSGHPFNGVQANGYWSSSTCSVTTTAAWYVYMDFGFVLYSNKINTIYVWPVRGGL